MELTSCVSDLDSAQQRVVEARADERVIVVAGAGQGKTQVVAARLAHLVKEEALSASTEVVTLSFSRAAVRAVEERLAEHEMAEVNVRTFDSFASQLLLDLGEEPVGSFDSRIRQATQSLQKATQPPDIIVELQHLIVDEVQDLVGDRAEFVLAILGKLSRDAGFTALGDPLQGIYDFVLRQSVSQMTFDQFYENLTEKFEAEIVGLERNYRARGEDSCRVAQLAKELREVDASLGLEQLRRFENSLPHIATPGGWEFLDLYAGNSAILCRSNAEVLRISRSLLDYGIQHTVRRRAESLGAARWIAPSLKELRGPEVPKGDVLEALTGASFVDEVDAAWHQLKVAEGSRRFPHQLNLARLRARVSSRALPLSLAQADEGNVIVSTIHRAKGLEFDNVFIVDSDYPWESDSAQLRTKYVALSRARDNIVTLKVNREYGSVREYRWLPGRQQERVGRKGKTRPKSIEFKPDDVYTARPASTSAESAQEVQRALRNAHTGSVVSGVLDVALACATCPVYSLSAEGATIGRTSEEFGNDFARLFDSRTGEWPSTLNNLLLVSIESTAGDPVLTEEAGVGPSGFWLIPRVVGLARPQWTNMEKVE